MANKRGNGEGSILKLKNGSYMGKIVVGRKPDGKQNRKSVYGKTRKEVSEKLIALANEINIGNYIEPSKLVLGDWLKNWLKQYKSIKLKPTTYDCYESLININIIPSIGKIMLKDLKTEHIQRFYNEKYQNGNGVSTATIRKIHIIIKSSLDQAITNDLILKNPAKGVQLPKHKQKDIKAFTIDEQNRFMEFAKDYRLFPAFLVNIDTGLRLGEILALTWDDVDLCKGTISINKNVEVVKDRDINATKKTKLLNQDTTKSKSGKRKIPLTQRSIKILKELKIKQQAKSKIVFCSETGTHVSPRNYERTFEKVIKKAGIKKCNSHTLRHTFATRLFEQGIPAKTVSELLGHSSVSFTLNIYTHVLPETKVEAVKALDNLYSNG